MPAIDATNILVELVYAFGVEAGRHGCRLADDTPAKMREVFTRTIEAALKQDPGIWTE